MKRNPLRACWGGLCLILVLGLVPPLPSYADEVRLQSIGVRGGTNGLRVLGGDEPESIQQYDAVVTLGLPWSLYSESGWGLSTKLMTSVGALTGAGDTGFLATFVPAIAF